MAPSLSLLFDETKKSVEDLLHHYLINPDIPSPLLEAMTSSVKNGGKRLRPTLAVACATVCAVSSEQAVRVGAAIEMAHCYSLIHDDLPAMDNANLRRGHPSCWKQFGEATAILAGDALLPLAFEVLGDEAVHSCPAVRLALIKSLAQDLGGAGMAGGQMLDLSPHLIDSIKTAALMQNLKTGCLIAFSCEAGAILAQKTSEERQLFRNFGFLLGLAYQIQDDLADIEGNADDLGKPVGMDRNKRSLVTLLGTRESKRYMHTLQEEMMRLIKPYQYPIFVEIIRWITVPKNKIL